MNQFNTKFIPTSQGTIRLLEAPNPGKQTLVFLHGNSMSADCFQKQFGALSRDFHLIAYDFPGHGKSERASDKKKSYGFKGQEALVIELHHKLELKNPIYVGQSLGGHVILESLAQLPNVKGVAIVGVAPFNQIKDLARIFLPDPTEGNLFKEELDSRGLELMVTSFLSKENHDWANKQLVQAAIESTEGAFRRELFLGIGNLEKRREIEATQNGKTPIAVFMGSQDAFINHRYFEELDQNNFWGKQVHYFEKSGHLPHIEEPEKFNAKLKQFVEEVA